MTQGGVERLLVDCEAARQIKVSARKMEGLLVRQDYFPLVDKLMCLIDDYHAKKNVPRHLNIYGQPGVGKSLSLYYILALLLSFKHNVAIFAWGFGRKFIMIECDKNDVPTVTEHYDETSRSLTALSTSFTVMATSPDRPSGRNFGKDRNEVTYIMDLWSLEEVKQEEQWRGEPYVALYFAVILSLMGGRFGSDPRKDPAY
ncbi:hypothetical protein MNV49_002140 [Pseudohyphozyma bogoriensis]|nr:hypothetical protein MNV49_002140 [Pseudohyphozyma bogoriensis]